MLVELGFKVVATRGTALALQEGGVPCQMVYKVTEGRPHIVDMIKNEQIVLIINTTQGKQAIADSYTIRREALNHKVAYTTTMNGGRAMCDALRYLDSEAVNRLQDLHKEVVA